MPWSPLVLFGSSLVAGNACSLPLQVWRAQLAARLWVRNGYGGIGVEAMLSHCHEQTADKDMLLLQCWVATAAPGLVLQQLLAAFGAGSAGAGAEGGAEGAPAALGSGGSDGLAAALRLLVVLLRDRTLAGLLPEQRIR
jgi:hypothetical protein